MKQFLSVILFALLLPFGIYAQSKKPLAIGDEVPAFTLTDQNGKEFKIADHIGKHALVIYFYPKDESMVCTKEACAFRDSFDDFTKAGAIVIGINGGTVASHKHFADKEKLPFVLLSDPHDKVLKQFGVKNSFFMSGRETFVVDLHGKIAFTYTSMIHGVEHSQQALAVVQKMKPH
ncbi:peroxiredoxin [Mucilaginibacter sp. AW1-3]